MSTETQKIVDLLKEQVVEQTLSLKGIEHVQAILDENEKLKTKNTEKDTRIKALEQSLTNSINTIDSMQKEISRLLAIESELVEKQTRFYQESIKFNYEEKRGNELKEILGMALRNPVITKSRQYFDNNNTFDSISGSNTTTSKNGDDTTTETVG